MSSSSSLQIFNKQLTDDYFKNMLMYNTINKNGEPIQKEVRILYDKENNPWFVGKDVTRILGYKRSNDSIRKHVEDYAKIDYKTFLEINCLRHLDVDQNLPYNSLLINEPGIYMLAMYSNEPIAKDFQKWIFVDILPSIRKYGEYKLQKECDQLKKDNEQFKKYLIETNNEYTQRIERIREPYNSVKKELHELQEKISNRDELILIKLYKKKISYLSQYYLFTDNKQNIDKRINKLKKEYNKLTIIKRIEYNSDIKKLLEMIKNYLETNSYAYIDDDNYIHITDKTIDENRLIKIVEFLHQQNPNYVYRIGYR